jgi:hypothetical protein
VRHAAAVQLDRSINHIRGHPRGYDLDRRDLLASRLLADRVHHPGGLQDEQASLLDRHPRLGDPILNDALSRELLAECHARDRAGTHQLERPLGKTDRAHAVVADIGAWAGLAVAFVLASLFWSPHGTLIDALRLKLPAAYEANFHPLVTELSQFAQYVLIVTGVLWYTGHRHERRRSPLAPPADYP